MYKYACSSLIHFSSCILSHISYVCLIKDAVIEDFKEGEGHSYRLLDGSNRSVCLFFFFNYCNHIIIIFTDYMFHL